jgi:hypothetical protein
MPDVQNLKNLDLKKHLIIQNNVTNVWTAVVGAVGPS